MRVELIYTPGCRNYIRALHILELVIAEERLPLPIELVEEGESIVPGLRIDGVDVPRALQCVDTLRDAIRQKWHDMTVSPLGHR
ncbi:MAG: hypothetical protein K2Z81_25030 [Cyanobacteria bacterium]|nr:hypothetical protein [Cyanobacteriota bacterium]